MISGISLSPKRPRLGLYYLLFFDSIGQEEVCIFLREVLRHLRGPVVVLLDNSSTHKGEPLQKLMHQHPRLSIKYFPSYAPELNPDEGVWSLAKRDLANTSPKNVDELMEDILRSIERIKASPKRDVQSARESSFFRFHSQSNISRNTWIALVVVGDCGRMQMIKLM